MASTIVLTGYDDNMAPVGDRTRPSIEEFALYRGFSFRCVREYHNRSAPTFQKVEAVLAAFKEGYENAIWIDADVIITNKEINPLNFAKPGINVSTDWATPNREPWRHFSMGVFVASRESIPVFEWLMTQTHWYFKHGMEQAALQDGLSQPWIYQLVHLHPRRFLNSVDRSFDRRKVEEPWQPGDLLCHLTGRPNRTDAQRIAAIEGYLKTGRF